MTFNNKDSADYYKESLLAFMTHFSNKLEILNALTGSKAAFVTLIVRDPSEGNVDIASNLTSESLIPILEFALLSVKEDTTTKGE